ncbi:hypothetical protein M378DRAFT_16870 [Amanita muscaria Koide BX008]|uniref:Retrotransposon gag domain-containing protein n=1 Tax=Amanita muscaria (strain Koide BX008) TaxID=946122 RepID=A0A0C2WKI4_AMAMK|nr:hypothetical protein M378DRAFT_16870 [Amanita muscaria Koide BX008]
MSASEGTSTSMHTDLPRDTRQTEKKKEEEEEEVVLTANEILQMFRESTIQISHMRASISELTATVGALRTAPAATAPAATALPLPVDCPVAPPFQKMPKMPLPEAFDRAMKNVDGFLASCGLYIGTRIAEFPTEISRINWILSFCMKGAALDWCQSEMELGRVTGRMSFITAAELENKIQQQFGDTDKVATKILHLRTIKQGKRIAKEHIQDFRKAAIGSGYTG